MRDIRLLAKFHRIQSSARKPVGFQKKGTLPAGRSKTPTIIVPAQKVTRTRAAQALGSAALSRAPPGTDTMSLAVVTVAFGPQSSLAKKIMRSSDSLQHGDITQISPGLDEAHVMETFRSCNLDTMERMEDLRLGLALTNPEWVRLILAGLANRAVPLCPAGRLEFLGRLIRRAGLEVRPPEQAPGGGSGRVLALPGGNAIPINANCMLKCGKCPTEFHGTRAKDSLRQHVNKMHPPPGVVPKVWTCPYQACSYQTQYTGSLSKHKKGHKGNGDMIAAPNVGHAGGGVNGEGAALGA